MLVSGPDDEVRQERGERPARGPAAPREPAESGESGEPAESGESAWQRRRRLDAVFGEVLPETTRDDRDDREAARDPSADPAETWLRAQVPPHHGG